MLTRHLPSSCFFIRLNKRPYAEVAEYFQQYKIHVAKCNSLSEQWVGMDRRDLCWIIHTCSPFGKWVDSLPYTLLSNILKSLPSSSTQELQESIEKLTTHLYWACLLCFFMPQMLQFFLFRKFFFQIFPLVLFLNHKQNTVYVTTVAQIPLISFASTFPFHIPLLTPASCGYTEL